jgi:hypothetical protein
MILSIKGLSMAKKKKAGLPRIRKRKAVSLTIDGEKLEIVRRIAERTGRNLSQEVERWLPSSEVDEAALGHRIDTVREVFARGRSLADVLYGLVPSYAVAKAAEKYAGIAGYHEVPEQAILEGFVRNLADRMCWDREHPLGLQVQAVTADKSTSERMDAIAELFCNFMDAKSPLSYLLPGNRYKSTFEQVELEGRKYWLVLRFKDSLSPQMRKQERDDTVRKMEAVLKRIAGDGGGQGSY